jgi:hypothetical protein
LRGVSIGGAGFAGGVAELELNASVAVFCITRWAVLDTLIDRWVFVIWLGIRTVVSYTKRRAFLVVDRNILEVFPARIAMGSELNGYQQIRNILNERGLNDILS